jgi:tripartite-type tricarboxylate transporter receptor subunit TctC
MQRRHFGERHRVSRRAACLGIGAALVAGRVRAADWPTRPVTVIVPFAPGGNTDTMARFAAQYFSQRLGQSFVVENRAGGAGAIGAIAVARAQPDGYTLLFGASTQIVNLPMLQKLSYDPDKDLVPISIFGAGPYLLGVKASLPVTTLKEFIAYAKANPGKLNYGIAGYGGNIHLNTALFLDRAGLTLVAVPYRGGGPAMAALLRGEIDMYFGNASELAVHRDSKEIKILAVSTLQRLSQLPAVPTVAELYPGFDTSSWNGLFAPTGTPQPIIDLLARETAAATHDATIADRLAKLDILPFGDTPQEFRKVIAQSRLTNRQAMKAAGLTVIQ